MIEVKHIWFSYEQWGEFVLKDISFSVEKGEIVGVLGANGVGKTTLLKVLAGLLPPRPREKEPERGVWLDGKPIRECNAEIAFISEAGTYLKDLTPREYGAFLRLRGKANQEDVQGAKGEGGGCRRHGEKGAYPHHG